MSDDKVLLKADKTTLVVEATKDGKLRVAANGIVESPAVIGEGETLDVRWEKGQVMVRRRDRKKR